MKITVRQLRNLIKEEVQNALFESYDDEVRSRVIKRGGGRDSTEAVDSNSLYLWTDEGDWMFIGPPRPGGRGPYLPPMSPKAQQAQLKLLQSLAPGETTEVPQYDIILPRNNALPSSSPPPSDRQHGDFESMRSSLPTKYRH